MSKLKVGDIIWSNYFQCQIEIVKIDDDNNWYFKKVIANPVMKAQTPLSYFEKQMKGGEK